MALRERERETEVCLKTTEGQRPALVSSPGQPPKRVTRSSYSAAARASLEAATATLSNDAALPTAEKKEEADRPSLSDLPFDVVDLILGLLPPLDLLALRCTQKALGAVALGRLGRARRLVVVGGQGEGRAVRSDMLVLD